jgi:hypothetical protein
LGANKKTLYYDLDLRAEGSTTNYHLEWKVVAPGKILSHNADKVRGCTLTWKRLLNKASNHQFQSKRDGRCSSSLATSGNTWLIIGAVACCCLLVVVIAVVAVFLWARKKKPH